MVDLKNFLKKIWFTIIKKYDITKEFRIEEPKKLGGGFIEW